MANAQKTRKKENQSKEFFSVLRLVLSVLIYKAPKIMLIDGQKFQNYSLSVKINTTKARKQLIKH